MDANTVSAVADLVVHERFRGPPRAGNGGYVAGRLGALLGPSAEVTLRRPAPLGERLAVTRTAEGLAASWAGEVVAEARAAAVEAVPPAVGLEAARAAGERYRGLAAHPVPGCFVCGPGRPAGDGLRLFPGPIGPDGAVAAPWTPDPSLADATGTVRPEFVWSALDCPGAWSFPWPEGRLPALGRLAARLSGDLRAGRTYVVVGWPLGDLGERRLAATAVLDPDGGAVLAVARATWFLVSSTWLRAASGG